MHKPIKIDNLSLSFHQKICFESFTTEIHYGNRIAIIGRNGSGKTSLLNILRGINKANSGSIHMPSDAVLGYVPQVITDFANFSGGERLNRALTQALNLQANILLLDEPTNHLDEYHRRQILRWLANFSGTLLIVSHDLELLRQTTDIFWHLDQNRIDIFKGDYDDYQREIHCRRNHLQTSLQQLKSERKTLHHALMQEQQRAAKSKAKGAKSIRQKKWPTIVSDAKASRSQATSGKKKSAIAHKKQIVLAELADLYLPEIIIPKFHLPAKFGHGNLLNISQGNLGYASQHWLLENIYLSITAGQKIALLGNNGSGKSTLFKAILNDPHVVKSGDWLLPKLNKIGYLDQHYNTLCSTETVLSSITRLMSDYSANEIRLHLNDFLFRSQDDVNKPIIQLSGGEKVRLSLAHIAAQTPELLLLDEVTNNLDLETRQHMIDVLRSYPGSLLVISHDRDFLQAIEIQDYYEIKKTGIYQHIQLAS